MEKLLHLLGREGKLIWVDSMQNKQEFIVARLNDKAASGYAPQTVCDLLQDKIASRIAEREVDLPKPVNIQNEKCLYWGSRSGSAFSSNCLIDQSLELGSLMNPGYFSGASQGTECCR